VSTPRRLYDALRDPHYYEFELTCPTSTEVGAGQRIQLLAARPDAKALQEDPEVASFSGHVSDSARALAVLRRLD